MSAASSDDMMDAIQTIASRLVGAADCPPTNLDQVAECLNATISEHEIFGSGELRKRSGKYEIVYAKDLPFARRRFTIAHELAHIVIDQTGSGAPRTGKELERLCDLIAAEILMPTEIFRSQLPPNPRLSDLFLLAKRFQTSLSATAQRCAEMSRVTTFEVAHKKILWARGTLRKSRALDDDSLRMHIKYACDGRSATAVLFLSDESSIIPARIEYHSFGDSKRALFMISRLSKTQAELESRER